MWPGIPDTYQKLPESDSGSFRYTRSRDYQTPTRHVLLGSGRPPKTGLLIFAAPATPVTVNCWCGTPTLLTEFWSVIKVSGNAIVEIVLVAAIFVVYILQRYISLYCLQGLFVWKIMPLARNISLWCLQKQTCLFIWKLYFVLRWFSICIKFIFDTMHYLKGHSSAD